MDNELKKRVVSDYSIFIEGDFEPSIGKKIAVLVYKEESYIVFLDVNLYIEWAINDHYVTNEEHREWNDEYGSVIGQVAFLETLSHLQYKGKYLLSLKRLLAQAIASLLDHGNSKNAQKIIDDIKSSINIRARINYFFSASFTFLSIMLLFLISTIFLRNNIMESDFFWTKSLLGSLGAYLSIILSIRTIKPQVSIGKRIHFIEGFSRIFYGIIAAGIALILVKSNLLLGFINDTENNSSLISAICVVAGFSEKYVPNLLDKFGSRFLSDREIKE